MWCSRAFVHLFAPAFTNDRYLGTSGVAIQGKTGEAMLDGRDGEAMMARANRANRANRARVGVGVGSAAAAANRNNNSSANYSTYDSAYDNGARFPQYNLVANNVFADIGMWDKQVLSAVALFCTAHNAVPEAKECC